MTNTLQISASYMDFSPNSLMAEVFSFLRVDDNTLATIPIYFYSPSVRVHRGLHFMKFNNFCVGERMHYNRNHLQYSGFDIQETYAQNFSEDHMEILGRIPLLDPYAFVKRSALHAMDLDHALEYEKEFSAYIFHNSVHLYRRSLLVDAIGHTLEFSDSPDSYWQIFVTKPTQKSAPEKTLLHLNRQLETISSLQHLRHLPHLQDVELKLEAVLKN